MSLNTYISYDEVRATLGVSLDEIGDEILALPIYSDYLMGEFEDISSTLAADFDTVAAIASTSRSTVQTRFHRTVRLFASFATARQLAVALPLFSPKDISEGKSTLSRYADSPYKEVIKRVKEEYDRFKIKVKDSHDAMTTAITPTVIRSYMGKTGLSTDPVTGS